MQRKHVNLYEIDLTPMLKLVNCFVWQGQNAPLPNDFVEIGGGYSITTARIASASRLTPQTGILMAVKKSTGKSGK